MSRSPSPASESPSTPLSPRAKPEDSKTSYFQASNSALPASPVLATNASPRLDSIPEHVKGEEFDPLAEVQTRPKSGSVSTISFKLDPAEREPPTWGKPKHRDGRIRSSSPAPPNRFKHHVSFDNFSGAEPTENNTIAFTLNSKHTGYQYKKRSRTFMVGIDEHEYSNTALKWMLDELVDDGDEIVCVRVVEPDAKISQGKSLERKQYKEEAKIIMGKVQEINNAHRAISIVLEFAVGKLHTTFQKMISLYEPAMLIVGTKGRSLGGFQGLMGNRSSFSKWCLQYSPIPVVVVRPDEKREKKKLKRANDPTRRNYAMLLADAGTNIHETNAKPGGSFQKIGSIALTQDQEAHAVAAALGLPTRYDPSVKPTYIPGESSGLHKVESVKSQDTNRRSSNSSDSRPGSPSIYVVSPGTKVRTDSPSVSDDEEEESDEDEFEAVSGGALLGNAEHEVEDAIVKKERLHMMEVGEAAALAAGKARKASVSSAGTDDDDG